MNLVRPTWRARANVLALCREARIRELHHVSTAYVCGSRQGRIFESELDEGQDCRNEYEASKLEAERLVRGPDGLESVTVYRPAVISGDSKTGYTSTYHGLYLYLRLMAMAVPMQPAGEDGIRGTPIRLPMSGDEPRNVVPVDWVADVITHLAGYARGARRDLSSGSRSPVDASRHHRRVLQVLQLDRRRVRRSGLPARPVGHVRLRASAAREHHHL